VVLADNVSFWCNAVARGDVNRIEIGRDTNIQDFSMLHVSHKSEKKPEGSPLIIGERVTVGHHVILHGCRIGDECLIGMGATVMDDAVIESRVLLAAGSLVPAGKRLESGFLYMGSPVKQVRPLTPEEIAHFAYSAAHYVRLAKRHQA
jgi:carbonic anhydrase/acetyltransferase-like protein (isoleucine patch superfamily)